MNKRILLLLLACLTLLPLCACTENYAGKLLLAQNSATEYAIVLSKTASVVEKKAADELQRYLAKICGATFPILTDAAPEGLKELRVGVTAREAEGEIDREALGEEGFLIRNTGESIFLAGGGGRSTLYAVYSFLEEYLGVRYYTETLEKIPFSPTLAIEPFEDNIQIPAFELRQECHQSPQSASWNEKQKLNASSKSDLTPIAGGFSFTGPWFVHTLGTLLGWSSRASYQNQPCLTDPHVFAKVLNSARDYIKKSPEATLISISQNDSTLDVSGECECENCLAEKEKYGGASSGVMLAFVNHVASALRLDYPHLTVETLAYYYTQTPPTGIKAASNVAVRFCNAGACLNHSFVDEDAASDNIYAINGAKAYENLKGWTEVAETVYIWDYDTNFGCTLAPMANFDRLYENVNTYGKLGIKGVFMQGMRQAGEFDDLRAYLVAKLLWDPLMSEDAYYAHMMDFLTGYYGEGAPDIRAYIDYLEEVVGDAHLSMYHDIIRFMPISTTKDEAQNTVLDTRIIDKMNGFWNAAESKAQNYAQLSRIRRSRLPVLYYEIVSRFATLKETGGVPDDLHALNKRLFTQMQTYDLTKLKETLSVPDAPNFANAPLYWGWSGAGVYQPATVTEPSGGPTADGDESEDGGDESAGITPTEG